MGTTYNPAIVTDGLVLCLDAANKRSYPGTGTTWTDLMGNNNATLYNAITFSEDNAGTLITDATNEYVQTNSNISVVGSSARSICCWFYYENALSANILGYGQTGSGSNGKMFDIMSWTSGGYRRLITHHYGSGFDTISTLPSRNTLNLGEWNYLTVTYDSSVVRVYTNGEFSNEKTMGLNTTASDLFLCRGIHTNYNSRPLGALSSFYLFNRALSADEVRRNYEATVGRFS